MYSVIFYFVVFALVFVIHAIAMKCKNYNAKKWLAIIGFAIIFLLIGLRYQVGTDYDSYIDMYNKYANSTMASIWSGRGDFATKIIFGFLPYMFSDAKIIFWVYGFLTLYPLYKINKNDDFKYLAYSTLVFNLTILPICFNGIRQGAAMSFALLAFDYLRHNTKAVKPLVCAVIAAMLHTSALLMFPFLLIYAYSKKYNKNFVLIALIITILISIALTTFLKDLFVENDFYTTVLSDNSNGININWFIKNIIYYSMLLILILFMRGGGKAEKKPINSSVKDMIAMLFSGTIFSAVSSSSMYLFRISWYFSIYQIILIPYVLQNIKNKNTRVISKIICILALVVLFIFDFYVKGNHQIIPYNTWLFL